MFTDKELKNRACERAALMLHSFWEEQKDNTPPTVSVHSRIFERLIYDKDVILNKKAQDREYPEHVVPCAYIRNLAFKMYWEGKTVDDVTMMIDRLYHIAYITSNEAIKIDKKHKSTMPDDWNPHSDSILRRLEDAGVELLERLDTA